MNTFQEVRLHYRPCTAVPRPIATLSADAGPVLQLAYIVCPADRHLAITARIIFFGVRDFRWLPINDTESPWQKEGLKVGDLFNRPEGQYHRYVATFHNEFFEILAESHQCMLGVGDLSADVTSFLSATDCDYNPSAWIPCPTPNKTVESDGQAEQVSGGNGGQRP